MTEREEKLLFALALMAQQYLQTGTTLEHLFMTAGEHTLPLLADYGLVTYDGVGAEWSEKGRAFLARRDTIT